MKTSIINSSTKADVFLSYSHDDSFLVERIANKLKESGFDCWIDKDRLRAQERFNVAIEEAIDGAVIFLAFLSRTYVNKPYCIHEFDRAIEKEKCILAVCIDDVSEATNREYAYMFSFSAGHNILGLGSGINESDNIETFAHNIIISVPMEQLRRYLEGGSDDHLPPISTPDYIRAHLRLYHEKQYRQSGNYALNEIRCELFPAIKDTEISIVYKDEKKKNVSLIKYFSDNKNTNKHILITGEGGMGKTVSLLKTCEYLLNNRINAIYIPLSKIDAELTLDQYLERIVCGGNQRMWRDIKELMSAPCSEIPNVVLLLDGINEVSLDYIDTLIKRVIKLTYVDSYCGVQLVMTSRWLDSSLMHRLKEDVILLEMQPLDNESIDMYLENMGLPSVIDKKILSVIRTPLMLTLFSDVEKHKNKYQSIDEIVLEDNPNTAGKILYNFFQTQLYRAAEEENFDRLAHLVLLEFLLPNLAYNMIENSSMFLSEDDVWSCIDEINEENKRYKWYKDDKLRKIVRGGGRINADSLLDLAESSLHFLHKSDMGYEFLHQSFRDYFAAYNISNEIHALKRNPERIGCVTPLLQQHIFSREILSLVSDIVHEEDAQPQLNESGWFFPGKDSINASNLSLIEPLLSLWRYKNDESAQIAVANLFNIMKIGRQNILAWCDFTNLDLRKCWLNKCRFSEWFQNDTFASNFDGAWIDRKNFLTEGHESQINAIISDGERFIFSGDVNGIVKVYNIDDSIWYDTFQLQSNAVVDLAWSNTKKLLAILYENIVFCYSLERKKIINSFGNASKSKNFRYVKFTDEEKINVSFDLEPLVWCDTDGNTVSSELAFSHDVPARCAKWNPKKKEFIRSNMLQLLSVFCFDTTSLSWKVHPALKRMLKDENLQHKEENRKNILEEYLCLRDVGAEQNSNVNCIQYNDNGTKVLIAIQNLLIEYDAELFTVLNKKIFSGNVRCACYMKNGIIVGVSTNIVFLDNVFSEEWILQGSQIKSIRTVSESYDGDGYYLFSSNGELKKLDQQLVVQNMRFVGSKSQFAWVRDRQSNKIQMAFLPWKRFPNGARYTYESDGTEPLGWCYELVDMPTYSDEDERRFYKMDAQLMVVERKPPYKKIIFNNYTGIWIYGCSFKRICGDIQEYHNIKFVVQNGGITDVATE